MTTAPAALPTDAPDLAALLGALATAVTRIGDGPPELLRPAQAARLLSVGLRTFYELSSRADFPQPIVLITAGTHYRRADLVEWIAARPVRRTVARKPGPAKRPPAPRAQEAT